MSPVTTVPALVDAFEAGRALLQSGHVLKARGLLLASTPEARSAVAFVLARSYDPNIVVTLDKPDAGADIAEARRWYRRWYELALREGAVPRTMRLDLLLQSLDHAKTGP